MARISYVDPAAIADPELAADLEHSRLHGAPRPETQAIRFHVPAVAKAFMRPWKTIFRDGIVEHPLKELCRIYVGRAAVDLDISQVAHGQSTRRSVDAKPPVHRCRVVKLLR